MELVKTEVAALEVQEKIKTVEAAFTWPLPLEKGYFTTAIFVKTDLDKPYLIYCPKATAAISIDEESYSPHFLWGADGIKTIKHIKLNQDLSQVGDINFLLIPLGISTPKEIERKEIEKMFGIKVVD